MGKLIVKYTTLPEETTGSFSGEAVKTTEAHTIEDMQFDDAVALLKRLLKNNDVTLTAKLKAVK